MSDIAPRRMTKTQRIAKEKLSYYLWRATWEDSIGESLREQVPQAWHRLEHDIDVEEPKIKVTLRLDASVAKFYRAMGHGYQGRINRILATWAQLKISDFVRMEDEMMTHMAQAADNRHKPVPDDIEPGEWE